MAIEQSKVNEILADLHEAKLRFQREWTKRTCKTPDCIDFCLPIVLAAGRWTREEVLEAWLYQAIEQYMFAIQCPLGDEN